MNQVENRRVWSCRLSGEEYEERCRLEETLRRREGDFVEDARTLQRYIALCGISQEECARRLGRSQSSVGNRLRLMNLPADVLEGLRTSGILDPAEVETAIVEANGAINAFPYASKRPPTADEMNVDPGYEGLPMTLIMDGRIQTGNLGTAQLDQTQLEQMLSSRRLAAESVFFCSLDTQGRMMIQDRAGNVTQFQAIDPGEVKW